MNRHVKLTSFQCHPKNKILETIEIENVDTHVGMNSIKNGLLCLYGAKEVSEEISFRRVFAEKRNLDYYSIVVELKVGLRSHTYISEEDIETGKIKMCSADRLDSDFRAKLLKIWSEWCEKKKIKQVEEPIKAGLPCFTRVDFFDYLMEVKPFNKLSCFTAQFTNGTRVVKYAYLVDDKFIESIECYGPRGTVPAELPKRIWSKKRAFKPQLVS